MSKFIIKDDFWEVFPECDIYVVTAKGVNNKLSEEEETYKEIESFLKDANKEAPKHLTESNFTDNPPVKVWREAFTKFKTKKGARCSIEALLKRVDKGNEIGSINPLVDIYNGISLKHAFPCGGEDTDTFVGDFLLTKASGDESFVALGDAENKPPYPEEIIYKDGAGAVCRCWNWRDGVRTMITENTKNGIFVIESVDVSRRSAAKEAAEELKEKLEEFMSADCALYHLDINNKEIEI